MPVDHIRYDLLTQEALRGVVSTVLADAAKHGLPGEHHFKITFHTAAPGVRLSERMRSQYPESMTIILQHQFWDLVVGSEAFEVGLSFGGVPERLAIPFEAVTAFYDPAVEFGFQFEAIDKRMPEDQGTTAKAPETSAAPASRTVADQGKTDFLPAPAAPARAAAPPAAPDGGTGGEVVRLDRFRKK
jgi:uncharacterized protein